MNVGAVASGYVVGLGASGPLAEQHLEAALAALRAHPLWTIRAVSAFFANPATGGVTHARFVNGAALLLTALAPAPLLRALHAVEARGGRVRGTRWSARALDLDLLWALHAVAPSTSPELPHPRLLERPFALLPAIDVLERAGCVVPAAWRAAARRLVPLAQMSLASVEGCTRP